MYVMLVESPPWVCTALKSSVVVDPPPLTTVYSMASELLSSASSAVGAAWSESELLEADAIYTVTAGTEAETVTKRVETEGTQTSAPPLGALLAVAFELSSGLRFTWRLKP